MKFRELDTVKVIPIKGLDPYIIARRGLVVKCNKSVFGETYWIQWDDGKEDTVMRGSLLKRARFSS